MYDLKVCLFISIILALIATGCNNQPAESLPSSEPPRLNQKIETALPTLKETAISKESLISEQLNLFMQPGWSQTTDFNSASGQWTIYCGRLDGELDLKYQSLSKDIMEDAFCTLIQKGHTNYQIVEFEYGSTDGYVFDWIDEHGIDPAILK